MARSWHYPRWRRVLMQVTLWVIFGGTVAMAAWVVHNRGPAGAAGEWGPTISSGGVSIRLPSGWEPMPGDSTDVLLQASEHPTDSPDAGDDEPIGRTLIVQQYAVPPNASAEQFLTSGGPLKNAMIIAGHGELSPTDDSVASRPVTIAGSPGVMLETLRSVAVMPGQPAMRAHEWIACGIEPTGDQAVVLRLQRFGGENVEPGAESDEAVLAKVAGAMRFHRSKPAPNGLTGR